MYYRVTSRCRVVLVVQVLDLESLIANEYAIIEPVKGYLLWIVESESIF